MFSSTLIEKLRSSERLVVLTGAGVSSESGVPTFRGEDGLWKKFRPEELASVEAFMRNPELVWEWYGYRKKLAAEVRPNPGHFALAWMETKYPDFWLITQNVDGLHARAGSRRILELHGNIFRSRCVQCGIRDDSLTMSEPNTIPRCTCGGLMRPDVVWFGEFLPENILARSADAAKQCELFLSIGTSAIVQPAASLPLLARESGGYVVEINIEPTMISEDLDETLIGRSGEILPRLLKAAWNVEI